MKVKIAPSCPTLCDPIDYTVLGILQAGILESVAFPFSRESSQPGIKPRSPAGQADLYQLSHQGSPRTLEWVAYPFSRASSWPRIKPGSPALQVDSLPYEPSGKPVNEYCVLSDSLYVSKMWSYHFYLLDVMDYVNSFLNVSQSCLLGQIPLGCGV